MKYYLNSRKERRLRKTDLKENVVEEQKTHYDNKSRHCDIFFLNSRKQWRENTHFKEVNKYKTTDVSSC